MQNFKQTQQHFTAMTLAGYTTQLPLPTFENLAEISKLKTTHFGAIARSGDFGKLMQASQDQVGYAYSGVQGDHLTYFAGANTTAVAPDSVMLPAGNYLVLNATGGPSRQLFDELIKLYFSDLLPQHPEWPHEDRFVVETLLNGNPQAAAVALRIPLF